MNSALADFTADLLTESGALVEPNADGMEVLLPDAVAGLLEIPEHAKLCFSGASGDGIFVSYDSELLKKMAKLIGDRGRFSTIALAPSPVRLEKLEDRLEDKLVFHNAVYHVEGKEEKPISYLLGYAKYSARSDDRKEGIVACLINELNLSVQKTTPDILQIIAGRAEEPLGDAARENSERVLPAFARAQGAMVKEALGEFLTSMERRLNGDVRRVHDYYQILIHEQRRLLEKRSNAADDQRESSE